MSSTPLDHVHVVPACPTFNGFDWVCTLRSVVLGHILVVWLLTHICLIDYAETETELINDETDQIFDRSRSRAIARARERESYKKAQQQTAAPRGSSFALQSTQCYTKHSVQKRRYG